VNSHDKSALSTQGVAQRFRNQLAESCTDQIEKPAAMESCGFGGPALIGGPVGNKEREQARAGGDQSCHCHCGRLL